MPPSEVQAASPTPSRRQRVAEAANAARRKMEQAPQVAVIAGGRQAPRMAEVLEEAVSLPALPGGLEEESGGWGGTLGGLSVVVVPARSLAAGYSPPEAAFPVRVAASLGAEGIVLTGQAAGLSPRLRAGDVMLVTDHLNLQGASPLTGANEDAWGARFPDMTAAYDAEWRAAVQARAEGATLRQGIYAAVAGAAPSTPAERTMLHRMGADAVGWGLAPEVLAARHMSRRVFAIVAIARAEANVNGRAGDDAESPSAVTSWVKAALEAWPVD